MKPGLKAIIAVGVILLFIAAFVFLLRWVENQAAFEKMINQTETRGYYRVCGCGCCSETSQTTYCIYRALNETLGPLIKKDLAARSNPQACAAVGCSEGILYKYCD
jgi:hypothetical protein